MSKAAGAVKAKIETLVWVILTGRLKADPPVYYCWKCRTDIIPSYTVEQFIETGEAADALSESDIIRLQRYFERKS